MFTKGLVGLTHPHQHPNFPGLSTTKSCAPTLVFIFRCYLPDHYTVDSNPEKVGKDGFYLNLSQFQHCILLLHLFYHINWHIWRHRCPLLPDPLPAQLQPRLPPTACDIGSDGSDRYGLSRGRAGHGAMAGVSEPKRRWEASLGAWDPWTFLEVLRWFFFFGWELKKMELAMYVWEMIW